jgi:hypothetical protein
MKGFIAGFLLASALGAGLVWAQSGYVTDLYGNPIGTIHQQPQMPQQNFMGPAQGMGQQLQGILNNQRNPC